MSTLRFPNRTAQRGVVGAGTTIDVDSAYDALPGQRTFAATATASTWVTGDTVSILVKKDNANWSVGTGTWDGTAETFAIAAELTVGTLSESDNVDVVAVTSEALFEKLLYHPKVVVISGSTHTIAEENCGCLHRCTYSGTTTISTAALSENWHGFFVRETSGDVAFDPAASDTINGSASVAYIQYQWKSAYLYLATGASWVLVA